MLVGVSQTSVSVISAVLVGIFIAAIQWGSAASPYPSWLVN